MSFTPTPTRPAVAIAAMAASASAIQRTATQQWAECYQMAPETYQTTVTKQRPKTLNGVQVEPLEMEDYQVQETHTRMIPDLAAIQQFYDDAEDLFTGAGLALCLAGFGVAANYVHALELSDGQLPTDLQAAANDFFTAALTFREQLKTAGIPEWVPLTPPVTLTPSPIKILVTPLPNH